MAAINHCQACFRLYENYQQFCFKANYYNLPITDSNARCEIVLLYVVSCACSAANIFKVVFYIFILISMFNRELSSDKN